VTQSERVVFFVRAANGTTRARKTRRFRSSQKEGPPEVGHSNIKLV